jgi:hypothetical protein
VYYASLHEALLVLSKLIVDHEDSINLYYLLNQVTNNPHLLEYATHKDVQEALSEHRKTLEDYTPLRETVRIQRNRVIAHLDRKHINDPSTILSTPVNMIELRDCYKELLEIVNVYKGFYDNSELHLTPLLDKRIEEDVDYLAELIEAANERKYSSYRTS